MSQSGMWQFVQPDAVIRPVALTDVINHFRTYSQDTTVPEGVYTSDLNALLYIAQEYFNIDGSMLLLSYYSDADTYFSVMASQVPLNVMRKTQPWRVRLDIILDPNTGLMTDRGVIFATQMLFQPCAPTSRLPDIPDAVVLSNNALKMLPKTN